jgi:hypothetical protein
VVADAERESPPGGVTVPTPLPLPRGDSDVVRDTVTLAEGLEDALTDAVEESDAMAVAVAAPLALARS